MALTYKINSSEKCLFKNQTVPIHQTQAINIEPARLVAAEVFKEFI
jgi:hypothetical protein